MPEELRQAAEKKEPKSAIINPPVAIAKEYLKNPCPNEDFRMTQIDLLKSNSIEIFCNLL